MPRHSIAAIAGLLLSAAAPAQANPLISVRRAEPSAAGGGRCLDRLCFETPVVIGELTAELKGAGLLKYLGFEVYSAALYVSGDHPRPLDAIGRSPLKLVLRYHRSIPKTLIQSSTGRALRHLPPSELEALRSDLDRMYGFYEDVREGDRYALVYRPETGLSVWFNGSLKGTIPGDAFARSYLGIWLSDAPLSDGLRDALSGR